MTLRLAFMGAPDFAVPTLRALAAAGHEIAAVYSQPPRPAGRRGLETTETPVSRAAHALGLEVRTPLSLKGNAEQAAFRSLETDAAIVVAYSLLLPRAILDAPRLGAWNGHASALPRWRGAAPIHRAVMAGDRETAMSVMRMEEALDTGPVALAERLAIGPLETTGDLHDRLMQACARLMAEAVARLEAGRLETSPQPAEGVLYARKVDKVETRIDWRMPAIEVHNRIRGLSSTPGAWCEAGFGARVERLKLLRSAPREGRGEPGTVLDDDLTIACGEGAVGLTELQRSGGRPLSAVEFLRGGRLRPGDRLL